MQKEVGSAVVARMAFEETELSSAPLQLLMGHGRARWLLIHSSISQEKL